MTTSKDLYTVLTDRTATYDIVPEEPYRWDKGHVYFNPASYQWEILFSKASHPNTSVKPLAEYLCIIKSTLVRPDTQARNVVRHLNENIDDFRPDNVNLITLRALITETDEAHIEKNKSKIPPALLEDATWLANDMRAGLTHAEIREKHGIDLSVIRNALRQEERWMFQDVWLQNEQDVRVLYEDRNIPMEHIGAVYWTPNDTIYPLVNQGMQSTILRISDAEYKRLLPYFDQYAEKHPGKKISKTAIDEFKREADVPANVAMKCYTDFYASGYRTIYGNSTDQPKLMVKLIEDVQKNGFRNISRTSSKKRHYFIGYLHRHGLQHHPRHVFMKLLLEKFGVYQDSMTFGEMVLETINCLRKDAVKVSDLRDAGLPQTEDYGIYKLITPLFTRSEYAELSTRFF